MMNSPQKESVVLASMFYLFKRSSFVDVKMQVLVEHWCLNTKPQTHCKKKYNKGDASSIYLFWTVRNKCSTNNLIVCAPACSGTSDIWKSNQGKKMSVWNSVVQLMSLFISLENQLSQNNKAEGLAFVTHSGIFYYV